MAGVELQQVNHFPGDEFPHSMPRRPYNDGWQNAGNAEVQPAAIIDQRNGHWEDVPQPVGDVAGQDRPCNPPHINMAYHRMADNYPRPLDNAAVPHAFPGVGLAQEVPAPALLNVPEIPGPFAYQLPPVLDQPAAENLRQLAIRYLRDPDSQVKLVCMEPGAAGSCKVVITVEIANVL